MPTISEQVVNGVTYGIIDADARAKAYDQDKNILRQGNWISETTGGMTYTFEDEGTIQIDGTQASTTFHDFYVDGSQYPSWLEKNAFYRIRFDLVEGSTNKSAVYIYEYNGSSTKGIYTGLTPDGIDHTLYFTPNPTYNGLIIRITTLNAASNYHIRLRLTMEKIDNGSFIYKPDNEVDVGPAITKALTDHNDAELAEGLFIIRTPIEMPTGGRLHGQGFNTEILLGGSATYAVNLTKENEVFNLRFIPTTVTPSITSPGVTTGIRYWRQSQTSETDGKACFIHNCWFYNCEYAGIAAQFTGGGVNEGLTVSDCYFEHCWCGIAIIRRTEYCQFSNCVTFDCTFGVINNGGNNKFTNCIFGANDTGMYLNTDSGTSPNDGHGQCIGCSFNHIGNNQGIAVKAQRLNHGFTFIGCHFWYSKVRIDESNLHFSGCTFGGLQPVFEISGSKPSFIQNCLFFDEPTMYLAESGTKIDNCYQFDGTPVTE